MIRVLSSLRWETTLQFRYGFYTVSALLIALMAGLMRFVPRPTLIVLLPAFLTGALITTTFYFMAALVLLEKGEGTLEGLVVTPLRAGEYLGAKVIALAGLAVIENLLLVRIGYGPDFNALWLVSGLLGLSVVYALIGFIAVSRFDSINEFIMPSAGITMLLTLPLVDHFGLWRSVIWYAHPIQPGLVLLRAAFGTAAGWEIAYAVLALIAWSALGFVLARRVFERFVVRAAGS